jgi:hypothetical protein
MRAITGEIVNVPLDIGKNMTTLLPRRPDDAHLVCVQLKKKVEYKSSHIAAWFYTTKYSNQGLGNT